MPDIAMCNQECPSSKTCYRHPDSGTEPGGGTFRGQTWCNFKVNPNTGKCDYYWEIKR